MNRFYLDRVLQVPTDRKFFSPTDMRVLCIHQRIPFSTSLKNQRILMSTALPRPLLT
jgi:hypothetical protein